MLFLWRVRLFDSNIVKLCVNSEGSRFVGLESILLYPGIGFSRMISLEGISITLGLMAIFNTTLVSLIAVLIFVIVVFTFDCTIISFTILRKASCVCSDLPS